MSLEYNPPQKPKVPILLCPITAAYALEPYVLAIDDPEKYSETGELDYENDFVVAIGQLTAQDYSDFELRFGFTLKAAILITHNIQLLSTLKTEEDRADVKQMGLWHDQETNYYHTPAGKTKSSPETLYMEIAAFCLSRFGRIVAESSPGQYELADVSYETVMSHLNPKVLTLQDEEGVLVFDRLLNATGIIAYDTLKLNEESGEVDPLAVTSEKKVRPSRGKKNGAEKTKPN